jgi:hypothetical protein
MCPKEILKNISILEIGGDITREYFMGLLRGGVPMDLRDNMYICLPDIIFGFKCLKLALNIG